MRLIFPALFFALTGSAVAAETCVQNGSDTGLFFVAETATDRQSGWLAPGATLCAGGQGQERVAVFEDEDALEGCTRLLPGGGTEMLLRYAAFDNCLWQSHLD